MKGSFTGASEDRRGKFEEADGATLFLDEVGDMSARTQAKVLRALQEGRFTRVGGTRPISSDARVLSATNKDLAAEIRRGAFREDLYFRLAVVPIQVPPLRERAEDIPLLARHFLAEAAARFGRGPSRSPPEAVEALQAYRWPGNVRELKNLIERLLILTTGDEIGADDLPIGDADSDRAARQRAAEGCPRRFRAPLHSRRAQAPSRQRDPGRRGAPGRAVEPLPEAEELRDRSRKRVVSSQF